MSLGRKRTVRLPAINHIPRGAIAAIVHSGVFVIKTQSRRQPPPAETQVRLMIYRKTENRNREIAVKRKTPRIPAYGMGRIPLVAVLLYQLGNAVIMKRYRCKHMQMLVKPESSCQPRILRVSRL